MQRDEPAVGGSDDLLQGATPIGYVADAYSGEIAGYYLGVTVHSANQALFDAVVPIERRVVLIDTGSGDATAYDAASLVNQLARTDFRDDDGQFYWLKGPPGPWLLIDEDSERRIIDRARRLATPPVAFPQGDTSRRDVRAPVRVGVSARERATVTAPVAEPSESVYVRDPTPSCQILPPGSAYAEVYDFFDPEISRDEFEREVPPARRTVLRSGNSTLAYDAAQLLRATKGVAGNWERPPAQRTYVLSTATGSCIFDRDAYLDLLRRSTAAAGTADQQQEEEEEEAEATEEEEEERAQNIRALSSSTLATRTSYAPALQGTLATQTRTRLQRQRPMTTTARAREAVRPRIAAPVAPFARVPPPSRQTVLPALRPQPQPQQEERPRLAPTARALARARIHEAVQGARQGALIRLVGSPDFIDVMTVPLVADDLADALVRDFASTADPLPVALASLAVRSLGAPALSEVVDAAIVANLAQNDALDGVVMLRRMGFDPSDNAIIRSILARLTGPTPDREGAIAIIDALPLRDPTNYRRVLAAAARLGSMPVVRYVVESVLRDRPITRDEATLLADVASEAGQRAIASLFLARAEPLEPVPVSADYREREREYRGAF
ncbi:hypothetical protein pdul_cds_272 [Pandoravirus dulcis]|uniref:Uncharacterized protein n=1 Tax=Pandoravirus dulcis TaxID=1349409 RepID=S4VVW7_9VIRU|nr:hypothetical protein pdul_cds_272 [Pandoravirus dulcis]AGO82246.1 hypothetical protein pdul_cds_272 [Pandoravirus dulcis]